MEFGPGRRDLREQIGLPSEAAWLKNVSASLVRASARNDDNSSLVGEISKLHPIVMLINPCMIYDFCMPWNLLEYS